MFCLHEFLFSSVMEIYLKCMHGFLLDSHQLFRQCNVHDGEVVPKLLAKIKQETMIALCIHVAAIHVFPYNG